MPRNRGSNAAGYYIIGTGGILPQNTVVCKEGTSTGFTCGKIISNSMSVLSDGILMTDVVKTEYLSAKGDSGGPVYFKYYDLIIGADVAVINGMHFGGYHDSEVDYGFYCKYNNIASELDVTILLN